MRQATLQAATQGEIKAALALEAASVPKDECVIAFKEANDKCDYSRNQNRFMAGMEYDVWYGKVRGTYASCIESAKTTFDTCSNEKTCKRRLKQFKAACDEKYMERALAGQGTKENFEETDNCFKDNLTFYWECLKSVSEYDDDRKQCATADSDAAKELKKLMNEGFEKNLKLAGEKAGSASTSSGDAAAQKRLLADSNI